MFLDELRKCDIDEIKNQYITYLKTQKLSLNTIQTSSSDAFYLLRNDLSVDFWGMLFAPEFEVIARTHLRKTLLKNSHGNIESNINGYLFHLRKFKQFVESAGSGLKLNPVIVRHDEKTRATSIHRLQPNIPQPSCAEVEKYLEQWDKLINYHLQENALNKLFHDLVPQNKDISDILLKVSALNDFYSTNIFSTFPVARNIQRLNIDDRLYKGDVSLVDEIKSVSINGKLKQFYSFATKYCSHHNDKAFPIYDSYVDKVLCYYQKIERFDSFSSNDLKCYNRFKKILIAFQEYFGLTKYSLKQLDQFLWQLGKEFFPKQY